MKDLISIIVPVYNVEDYLHRCIDSVLLQTYNNFELILIDDGSPDKCGDICDEYAFKDSRVKVIHKENGGLSDARNTGIEVAKGKYIIFLDSDDWITGNCVENLYTLLTKKNADISVCNFIRTENEIIQNKDEENKVYEFSNIQALKKLTGEFYVQLTVSWGKLYKSELFKGIRFPLGKIHEDEFTTYKILYKANKIVFTTEPLLYYWQRADSIMGSGFKIKNRLHAIEAFINRANFFEEIGRIDLKNRTYRALFGLYSSVLENITQFEDELSKEKFLDEFNVFIKKLKSSDQSIFFSMYLTSKLRFPTITKIAYKWYEKYFK